MSSKRQKTSELSRKELISTMNESKTENISSLEIELSEYKNESKKRLKSSGSEALDRQTVNKKSFSDRICDDISEVILQYLPFENKSKYESVCNQFQRTVYRKDNELNLKDGDIPSFKILEKYRQKFLRLNCLQKLTSITIICGNTDFEQLFTCLKQLPDLKTFIAKLAQEQRTQNPFNFNFFEGLTNLINLVLQLSIGINQTHLTGIDINLPKLKFLKLIDVFDTTPEGVTQMADILSRLSKLKTLKLKFNL